MTRIMYDAVTASNVPPSATLVAGYGDGYYQNVAEFRARFPHATVVEIAVSSHHNLGVVLDVETGDATPAEAPGWVTMRRAAGVDPTIYCNSSTWPSVRAAFKAARVPEPHWWIAQYDGDPAIFPGAVAKQYADPGPYDLSSVAAYWPGVDPAPTPAPTPAPSTLVEEDVLAYLPLIPANTNFDVPVEPAGTVAKPMGGARNGPMWLEGCAQGADGTVSVSLHTAKGWGAPVSHPVTVAGPKMGLALPEDGSVDKVRLHSTVPLLAYVVGRQVA